MSETEILRHLTGSGSAGVPHNEVERIALEDRPGREAFRLGVMQVVLAAQRRPSWTH